MAIKYKVIIVNCGLLKIVWINISYVSNSNVGLYMIILPLKAPPRCYVSASRWGPTL